ncbi:hypothetical protein E2C01_065427 [Portunus trituberculatus]|uniref:Uncharacterized protein n=1 Tax=Portunus trituberculatus TaxID=210409 RepID=A0A5B7HPJ5_PORTR|nr:hypothetical protein [Portunus trituberculatus]
MLRLHVSSFDEFSEACFAFYCSSLCAAATASFSLSIPNTCTATGQIDKVSGRDTTPWWHLDLTPDCSTDHREAGRS